VAAPDTNLFVIPTLQVAFLNFQLSNLISEFLGNVDPLSKLYLRPALLCIHFVKPVLCSLESGCEVSILLCEIGDDLLLVLQLNEKLERGNYLVESMDQEETHLFLLLCLVLKGF
jgi:hypothetical protein